MDRGAGGADPQPPLNAPLLSWYLMPDRELISGSPQSEDLQFEAGLRPRRLVDFTGQSKLKENLSIAIAAARLRGEAMDHVLLYGPPGLGKTTLAAIIGEELEVSF